MELHEFSKHMERLKEVYGDRAYPEERIKIIWQKTKWRSEKVWEETTKRLIADSMQPPMLSKILEMYAIVQRDFPEIKTDPYAHIRDELRLKAQKPSCTRCGGHGTLVAFKKYNKLQSTSLICNCYCGGLAKKLPENRADREINDHDFFYMVFEFDPNKEIKFDWFKDLSSDDPARVMNELSDIYYNKEIYFDPCYWVPKGWNIELKNKFERRQIDEKKYREEIQNYILAFQQEEDDKNDPWWK